MSLGLGSRKESVSCGPTTHSVKKTSYRNTDREKPDLSILGRWKSFCNSRINEGRWTKPKGLHWPESVFLEQGSSDCVVERSHHVRDRKVQTGLRGNEEIQSTYYTWCERDPLDAVWTEASQFRGADFILREGGQTSFRRSWDFA